ncbi:MAG TPA: LptA/OstA family protein [Kiritimatiellia bacterium]|nr:LptA/OstA family protein [Kiritimatiellia bacterium]
MKMSWKYGRWIAVAGLVLGLTGVHTGFADGDQSTIITSEKLTFDYQNQFALFENDVIVVDPQMRIFADTLRVMFDNNNRARLIRAEGRVRILQDDKQARAQVAVYHVDSGKIVLTGDPMVTRGRDTFTAVEITYWRDDNRVEGKPQARLVIHPEGGSRRDVLGGPAGGR